MIATAPGASGRFERSVRSDQLSGKAVDATEQGSATSSTRSKVPMARATLTSVLVLGRARPLSSFATNGWDVPILIASAA